LHAGGIIHRDVKAENIILDKKPNNADSYRACLADFGIACHISEENELRRRCGSPGTVPPEILQRRLPIRWSPKGDLFGAGVVLYMALTGEMPFQGEHIRDLLQSNSACKVDFTGEAFNEISKGATELLMVMLARKANRRPTAGQATERIMTLIQQLESISATLCENLEVPSHDTERIMNLLQQQQIESISAAPFIENLEGSPKSCENLEGRTSLRAEEETGFDSQSLQSGFLNQEK
jgi:serine/threonine protein kinase